MRRLVGVMCALFSLAAAGPADRLLVGGVVHTPEGPRQVVVAIRDGRIVALPSAAELGAWRGEETEVVDLAGGHVLPGLVDSHLHLAGYGAALEQVDLVGAISADEMLARAVAAAGKLPPEVWLEGRGWDQNLWPDRRFPDRAGLDERLAGRPVLLRRVDGHAVLASGRALALAGVDRDTPDPPGGRVVRRADGSPSGVLVDAAADLVARVVPSPSAFDLERRLVRAAVALTRLGLTQVHDMGTTAQELAALRRLAAENLLPIRVWVLFDGTDQALLGRELARGPDLTEGSLLRVGGVKLYADGALGSRGALLGADYADDQGNRGLAVTAPERLLVVTRRASAAGFQVAIHAIGDEAVHRVLDLYAEVGEETCRRLRHRVEHSQTVRPEDVIRYASLGVVASVQPTHCTSDMPWAPERLGPGRIPWAYRWRSLLEAGAALAGGSDAPVEDPDPRRGLYAAVTRQQAGGRPPGGWNRPECLSLAEALRLFTVGGAFAGRAEGFSGTIRAGAVADLTVLDRDPGVVDPEQLLHLEVLRTVVHGVDRFLAEARGPREGS